MKSGLLYLRHILDAFAQIGEYLQGKSFSEFQHNRLLQDGVIRQLAIIGEAARRLSSVLQQSYPSVPWSDVIGMRNILIHDYLEVDIREMWKTLYDDLPSFREQVEQILHDALKGDAPQCY